VLIIIESYNKNKIKTETNFMEVSYHRQFSHYMRLKI